MATQLPTADPAETVGDEEVSLSLERSPVTPPMNGAPIDDKGLESSDIDLKEDGRDGDLEEMVRKLRSELDKVKAVKLMHWFMD